MDVSPIRFTGLFSGMDTASMVQQLMRAESMRMDRFVRRRQTLAWRQEDMRSTINALEHFRSGNVDVIGQGSITSDAAWNMMQATVTLGSRQNPPGFSVTRPSNDARPGTYNVTVHSVAQGDMVRGGQFRGTASGITGPGYEQINLSTRMSSFLSGANWNASDIHYSHNVDSTGRQLFDLTRNAGGQAANDRIVNAAGGQVGNGTVGIELDANGDIASLRDSTGRVFTATVDGSGNNVLRHTTAGGAEIDIDRDAFQLEMDLGGQPTSFDPNDPDVAGPDDLRVLSRPAHTTVEINGAQIRINENDTIQQFMDRVNSATVTVGTGSNAREVSIGARMSFDAVRGTFVLESTRVSDSLADGQHARVFTGRDDAGFLARIGLDNVRGGAVDGAVDPTGPNSRFMREQSAARVEIDDNSGRTPVIIESSNNTFTSAETGLHGINFTISAAAVARPGEPRNEFTIEVGRNVENTMNHIRDFVENFNDLIRSLNALHSTPRPRAQNGNLFEPLTDAEREGMSDREIERWEEQARIGLLHRNDAIANLHRDLRSAMFQDIVVGPPGNQQRLNFSEFFTASGGSREERNIGVIDIDWERLEQALIEDPDRIEAMFRRNVMEAAVDNANPDGSLPAWVTGSWSAQRNAERSSFIGLGARINDILDNATHFDGSIRRQSGLSGVDQDANPMSRQLQEYDRRLEQMQRWLVRRENHFFNMFARMEAAMAQANAQMDSLWMMGNQ